VARKLLLTAFVSHGFRAGTTLAWYLSRRFQRA
jgi:hypothetical protein